MICDFIDKDSVLFVLRQEGVPQTVITKIASLPSFPAPNPDECAGRNIMGQTEEEFWDLVERKERGES